MGEITSREINSARNLPHGSGINCNWRIHVKPDGAVVFSNVFSAMNESGMYCCNYPFEVVYQDNGNGMEYREIHIDGTEECPCGCGYGLREYLEDSMPDQI